MLIPKFQEALRQEFMDAVNRMIDSGIELDPASLLVLDREAMSFAHDRASEMVGMRLVEGELIPNPNPTWAITDSTRDEIRRLVESAFTDGLTPAELAKSIEQSAGFSSDRALMISRTELANAHMNGGLESAIEAGMTHKAWLTNPDSPTASEDVCGENEDLGPIPLDEPFLHGSDGAAHPNCECVVNYSLDESGVLDGAV